MDISPKTGLICSKSTQAQLLSVQAHMGVTN